MQPNVNTLISGRAGSDGMRAGTTVVAFCIAAILGPLGAPTRYYLHMAEIGIAILFLGVLLAADRARIEQLTEKVRQFLDWLERSS